MVGRLGTVQDRLDDTLVDVDARMHRAHLMSAFADAGVEDDLALALHDVESDATLNRFARDVAPTLAALKERGLRVGVLSDIHLDVRPAFETAGLSSLVDSFTLSFEHGAVKPDPALFAIALAALSTTPEQRGRPAPSVAVMDDESTLSAPVAAAVAALREAGGPVAPARFAAGGDGEELVWTAVDHAIGTLVLVVSRRGVVAARIDEPGSDGTARLADVATELPRASFTRDDETLADVATHLAALASGLPTDGAPPLDVRGTAFQASVWAALRAIPSGQTRSYSEVAAEIGRPTAVRAVASACAANPAALVTPCHRVIRGDGGLGGFRWGLEVKAALLDAERAGARQARLRSAVEQVAGEDAELLDRLAQ